MVYCLNNPPKYYYGFVRAQDLIILWRCLLTINLKNYNLNITAPKSTEPLSFYHNSPKRYDIWLTLSLTKCRITEGLTRTPHAMWLNTVSACGKFRREIWKCNICCRYCIYHVKFNVCLVTKPLGVFTSETKWLNASLLFLRMNYVKNV